MVSELGVKQYGWDIFSLIQHQMDDVLAEHGLDTTRMLWQGEPIFDPSEPGQIYRVTGREVV